MSTRPQLSVAVATAACTSSLTATSVRTNTPPICSATRRPLSSLRSATTTLAPSAAKTVAMPRPMPSPAPVDPPHGHASPSRRGATSAVGAQDQGARRHPGPRGHEDMIGVRNLVDGATANLPNAFGDAVHPVQIGLAELPAVGVDGQSSAHPDLAGADEVLGLAPAAEPELLELRKDERGEVVVDHGRPDVVGPEA